MLVHPERSIELLRKQIEEANGGHPNAFDSWRERTDSTLRVTLGEEHPAIKRFDDVRYSLMMVTSSTPQSAFDKARAAGVRRAIAILEGAIHELESSQPEAPNLSPDEFHPWIAGAVVGLWNDGHHRQAVDEATRAIEIRLKSKLGVDLSGFSLVTAAFNPDDPKPGQPRLRFSKFDPGTMVWTDAHQGAMHFGQGCMMRVRNIVEHHHDEMLEQEALECLAALSLLARWIDEAEVVNGE